MWTRLRVEPSSAVPIWRQIEEGVRMLLLGGSLSSGAAVPSVREMARELRVNPLTVLKAYQRLIDQGLLAVRRGEGTYVSEIPSETVAEYRREILASSAREFAATARAMSSSLADATQAVARQWAELDAEEGGVQ
ncbi:MAG: GntR family transcriptional regulator [Candidatus Eisenbacteria bacterium]|jgi:GntR family transcriptional regulator|nr:GntR family transcriptional regulator [Candidatus Eisenbacteria bacterium]